MHLDVQVYFGSRVRVEPFEDGARAAVNIALRLAARRFNAYRPAWRRRSRVVHGHALCRIVWMGLMS